MLNATDMLLFQSHIFFLLKDLTIAGIHDKKMLACGRSTVKLDALLENHKSWKGEKVTWCSLSLATFLQLLF